MSSCSPESCIIHLINTSVLLPQLLRAFSTQFTNNIYYNLPPLKWHYCTNDRQTEELLIIIELAIQKRNNATLHGFSINPLKPELNPICYLLALLAHHFLHVSMTRVKSLTLRLLMSYIYMERMFLMFLDHTQRRTTVGRTPLHE